MKDFKSLENKISKLEQKLRELEAEDRFLIELERIVSDSLDANPVKRTCKVIAFPSGRVLEEYEVES